ncbi:MAG: HNH/ENDO VII family nuclease [Pseudobutyrivibrio sp.]|nr:HNH/ENDO VII family nuclease [Pseudobutyrivibrio sp.]
MMVVSLLLVLNFSIGVSASTNYDRQEADTCITISQRLSVKTSYGKSSPNLTKPKGWKVGDPIDNLTRTGKEPSWSTVRARYWKNKAYYYADDYLDSDLIRMRKGLAPIEPETGASMELHHKNGRDIPNPHNIENLKEVWPWEHDAIDKFRHYTGPRPKGE